MIGEGTDEYIPRVLDGLVSVLDLDSIRMSWKGALG